MKIMCECNEDTAQWMYTKCARALVIQLFLVRRFKENEEKKISESFSSTHTFNTLLVLVYILCEQNADTRNFQSNDWNKYYVAKCDIYTSYNAYIAGWLLGWLARYSTKKNNNIIITKQKKWEKKERRYHNMLHTLHNRFRLPFLFYFYVLLFVL